MSKSKSPAPLAVKRIRSKLGVSQSTVAKWLHVSDSMIGHYETGRKAMPVDRWELLKIKAAAYECNVAQRGLVGKIVKAIQQEGIV